MRARAVDGIHALLLASGIVALLTSCSHLQLHAEQKHDAAAKARRPGVHQRIAQVSFGRDAEYVVCAEPACPRVTPKSAPAMQTASASAAPATVKLSLNEKPQAREDRKPVLPKRLIVHFAPGVFKLDEQGRRALEEALPDARQAKRILVMGRTDSGGSARMNETLARRRALSVRDYLLRALADTNAAIVIDAKGSCCFVSGNDTAAGRRENRRVEVEFNQAGQERP